MDSTAYSLRHTYICLRLMEGADIYQIAKICRTSVEMIETFYASHIKNTLDAGISPGYNIIFGNIGETRDSLQLGVDFLLKFSDFSQMRTIRPVTPYPGSPLYYHAIEQGLLEGCEDFYENKHVNSDLLAVNFTDMSDDEFHRCLLGANKRLVANYFQKKLLSTIGQLEELYLRKNDDFRGFRHG